MFSGEEMAGRFLDLYLHHEAYLNLKGARRLSYLAYIDEFDNLAGPSSPIPNHAKKMDAYRTYLIELRKYLDGFLRKTQPLGDVDEMSAKAVAEFEEKWEKGEVKGWERQGEEVFGGGAGNGKGKSVENGGGTGEGEGIWCAACRRSYSKQTVYDAHLKSPKHLKAAARLASDAAAPSRAATMPQEEGKMKRNVSSPAFDLSNCS